MVASRLATAAPSLRILVVEAGPHTLNEISHIQPALYIHHILPGSKTAQFMVSNASEHLDGRQIIVPIGHCVGGGSSINCKRPCIRSEQLCSCIGLVAEYTRAAYSDFDVWRDKYGNPDWGFRDLLPYIKKVSVLIVPFLLS